MDAGNKKRFAYFSHYSTLGLIYCHVFDATKSPPAAVAQRITSVCGYNRPTTKIASPSGERVTGATLGSILTKNEWRRTKRKKTGKQEKETKKKNENKRGERERDLLSEFPTFFRPLGIFECTLLGMAPCNYVRGNGGQCVLEALGMLMQDARPASKKEKTASDRVVLVVSSGIPHCDRRLKKRKEGVMVGVGAVVGEEEKESNREHEEVEAEEKERRANW